jgi:hypothetical protein
MEYLKGIDLEIEGPSIEIFNYIRRDLPVAGTVDWLLIGEVHGPVFEFCEHYLEYVDKLSVQ